DFEFGDFTSWEPFIGTASPGVANPPAPAVPMTVVNNWQGGLGVIAGRHTVTSGTGTDYYGGFPVVAPGGGSHSLKLSDAAGGGNADKVEYILRVPVGVNNYSFNFKYAVLLEDPSHSAWEQPRFTVSVLDSATGQPIKNGCYDQN